MKAIRVYQCEDTPEGIFSAVYDAGVSGYGHDHIRIQALTPGLHENLDLFSEYIKVEPEQRKADKVLQSVRDKISVAVYEHILRVAGSADEDKADVIYHFIVYGFTLGAKVTDALQIPCVQRIFEMNRKIQNEVHYYLEFLRFQEISLKQPVLLAVFEPKNVILPLVTRHFADRLNPEWFIIYDKTHQTASFHCPDGQWYVRKLEQEEGKRLEELETQEGEYTDLWKTFFQAICIQERANSDLQRNHLPLYFRNHMPEFQ